eukprot:m.31432 g.31432  ORF g.31432 m.31432 type:complete len:59 (+) comp12070_c0_seq1:139-315(+)
MYTPTIHLQDLDAMQASRLFYRLMLPLQESRPSGRAEDHRNSGLVDSRFVKPVEELAQ